MQHAETHTKPLVVISGGSGFLGSAAAFEFIAAGWQVAVLSRKGDAPPGSVGYKCDITNRPSVEDAVHKLVSRQGRIRACIHAAAAPLVRKSILETSPESFAQTFAVAVDGACHLAASVIPFMDRGATFIGITSQAIEPEAPIGSLGAYVPAKAALRSFLRVLATELYSQSIRVYAVAPGFLPGGLNGDLPKVARDFISRKSGTTNGEKDIAKFLVKLAGDMSSYPAGISITFPKEVISPL